MEEVNTWLLTEWPLFRRDQPLRSYQRDLPHFRQKGVTYFVTFRLADSIPQDRIRAWKRERDQWLVRHPRETWTPEDQVYFYEAFWTRYHEWLDRGEGACYLRQAEIANLLRQCLEHFRDQRYRLFSTVLMPNHVHALVFPLADTSLEKILHSWKSYSANRINRVLKRSGVLWQHEGYDHIVRNPRAFWAIHRYIEENPAKARCGAAPLFGELFERDNRPRT